MYLGNRTEDSTIDFKWSSNSAAGASITRATNGTVQVFKGNNTTQTTAGVTDTEDFDALTGIHHCRIDTSADAFYVTGEDYQVVLSAATIDGQVVNAVLREFSIEKEFNEVDVTKFGGTAGNFSSGLPQVLLGNGNHGGGSALLTLERMVVTSTTTNEPAVKLTGNGTGDGLRATGGATASGISGAGGSTSGAGLLGTGTGGTAGIIGAGQGAGQGMFLVGGASGPGLLSLGQGNANGATFTKAGTGKDIAGTLERVTLVDTVTDLADGAINEATFNADTSKYQSKLTLFDDNGGTTDRYALVWFKNGQPVVSGITSPTIQVFKVADGADLIASAAMTQIASTGTYRYDATSGERIVSGVAYIAKVTATIDSATRTWYQPVGRDST